MRAYSSFALLFDALVGLGQRDVIDYGVDHGGLHAGMSDAVDHAARAYRLRDRRSAHFPVSASPTSECRPAYSSDGCLCVVASTTVSAVMLTMRRTVADGVRMCAGFATPSSIGPSVTPEPAATLSRLNAMFAASTVGMMRRLASPLQPRIGERGEPHLLVERGVAVHLAFAFEVGVHRRDDRERRLHLLRLRMRRRAEARMRQQRDLGHDAEAAHLFRGEQRDLGQLFRIGIGD